MASRRVEAAFDGQAVELGSAAPKSSPAPTNGNVHNHTEKIPNGSHHERKATPGKAAVLSIGRAVPTNTTKNDGLADHYITQFKLDDPTMQAKLRRLCKPHPASIAMVTSVGSVRWGSFKLSDN